MKNSTAPLARTTISLPKDVLKSGQLRKKTRRCRSLSNYVEILIAEDIASAVSVPLNRKSQIANRKFNGAAVVA